MPSAAMPLDHDSLEYSVMSYRSYVGAGLGGYTNGSTSYPQTLMMYDIAALQVEYGANYTTHSGNTVYTWDPNTGQAFIDGVGQGAPAGNKIFMTLWDGGGSDTYDFSNYATNLTVNLAPGGWTTTSATQLASLGGGHTAIGNIANALLYQGNTASLIENAIGGSGNDTITGNSADNHLTGGAGNDILDGGAGNDTAVYTGLLANYLQVQNANGTWTITDLRVASPDGTDTLNNIEYLQFNDGVVAVGSAPTPSVAAPTIVSFSTDTGVLGDGITSDNTPTLVGTAPAGSTVKVYDGAALVGSVIADGSGAWTFTPSALLDGAHTFTATAVDGGGNTSDASDATLVTVDTTAPGTAVIVGYSIDSGASGDGITNASALVLQGSAEAGANVHVYDGAMLLGTTIADSGGAWSFSTFGVGSGSGNFACGCPACLAAQAAEAANGGGITSPLSDGPHAFTAVAIDAAGNTGAASSVLNIVVDSAAPAVPTIDSFSTDTGTVGDGVTSDNTLTLIGSAEANSSVKVYDGATLLGTTGADGAGAWFYDTSTLPNGAHSFTAIASDAAGNESLASAPLNLTIDAPTLGDDTYYVNSLADVVTEVLNGGNDTVITSISYTLGANLENLTLAAGAGSINGTGNGLANVITGNEGNNVLDGGAGADTMAGGLGNDTYYRRQCRRRGHRGGQRRHRHGRIVGQLHARRQPREPDAGRAPARSTAPAMSLANVITGNEGNNVLDGGAGADTMAGGLGNDTYYRRQCRRRGHRGGQRGHRHGRVVGQLHARRQRREPDADRRRHRSTAPAMVWPTSSPATRATTSSTAAPAPTPWPAGSATTPTMSTMPATWSPRRPTKAPTRSYPRSATCSAPTSRT